MGHEIIKPNPLHLSGHEVSFETGQEAFCQQD